MAGGFPLIPLGYPFQDSTIVFMTSTYRHSKALKMAATNSVCLSVPPKLHLICLDFKWIYLTCY